MKKDYTHITIILDRTGSMESIREDTIGGFNSFLNQQKSIEGNATLTLVQFDSQDPYEVIHGFRPLKEVHPLTNETYVPRAATPLLDAIGMGINDLSNRITALNKKERPSKVIFVIVTDGEENSSREFTKKQIVKMIKKKTEKDFWQFVFLSADLSAIQEAHEVGFQASRALYFDKSAEGSSRAWDSLSAKAFAFRTELCEEINFDEDDRQIPKDTDW